MRLCLSAVRYPGNPFQSGQVWTLCPASPAFVEGSLGPNPGYRASVPAPCAAFIGQLAHPTLGCASYDRSMSVQISVRLPDRMIAFLDRAVAAGRATSRAALVTRALEREMRRELAEADAALLREKGAADDLDELVDWTAQYLTVED